MDVIREPIPGIREPIPGILIGLPHQDSIFYVEIEYETLLAFCGKCQSQGHNRKTYKWNDDRNRDGCNSKKTRDLKVWVPRKNVKENQDGAMSVSEKNSPNELFNKFVLELQDGAGPSSSKLVDHIEAADVNVIDVGKKLVL